MKKLLLFLLFVAGLYAQSPDCQVRFQFTAAGQLTPNQNNTQSGCVFWRLNYEVDTFSAISLVFQSADGAITPGTFGNYSGTVSTGSNPATNTTSGSASFNGWVGWYRVTLASATGTGTITGSLYGYKSLSANGTAAPSGAASGDLSGTYPGPTVAKVNGNTPGGTCTNQFTRSIDSSGRPTCATVQNADLNNANINISGATCTLGSSCIPVIHPIGFAFGDTGGSALTAGSVGYFFAPFACTISAWNIAVDAGTVTFDVWKIASGTAIPTVTNTITASALPALSSGTALHSTTLTGWTTSVAQNDIFGIQLKTVATAKFVSLVLQCA